MLVLSLGESECPGRAVEGDYVILKERATQQNFMCGMTNFQCVQRHNLVEFDLGNDETP